jgi:dienelactone hydrolase
MMDVSTCVGTWFLVAHTSRLELSLQASPSGLVGTIHDEGGALEPVDSITWDPAGRWLEFRRRGAGFFQWYRTSLTYGVLAGRFSHSTSAPKPALTEFAFHVTGWSPSWLDTDIVPRTWNVTLNSRYDGVLRVDRDANGALVGHLKVFDDGAVAGVQEELENDLSSLVWDGTHLSFVRTGPAFTQSYSGTATGRFIVGTFSHNAGPPTPWAGARGDVLGFGLGSRLPHRDEWQEETRARIVNLTEGMRLANVDIPPISVVSDVPVAPFLGGYPPERDDDPTDWPAAYSLQRLEFSVSPGSRFDLSNPPPPRVFYGYLAVPVAPPPAGGFRAMVAVNGHGGSAQLVMTASDPAHWYGESAARRDLVVLAIDIGHRPKWGYGPIVHRDVIDVGYTDSNWEEDGERAFSVRRAIDWLASLPYVRADRIFMCGLSLGGEVSTITAGLDPRIRMAVVAGFSPDMQVMDRNGNHPCYRWDHADIHEYLDVSDWEALTAPRPLVVETGAADGMFSKFDPPYAADKQVTRRARTAYGPDAPRLIHYLHYDVHHFHVGSKNPTNPTRAQGVLETSATEPSAPGDLTWQTNGNTFNRSPSLYDLMNEFLP